MKLKFTYRPRIKNSVAQKTLSRLLAFGVLINSVPINSFAETLSEDTRYETFTGNNITVNDVLEEEKLNIKTEGKTLVNYYDYNALWKENDVTIDILTKEVIFGNNIDESTNLSYTDSALLLKPSLDLSKTYTIIMNVIENTYTGKQFFTILDDYGSFLSNEHYRLPSGQTGIVKLKFTAKENSDGRFKIYLRNPKEQEDRGIVKVKDIMILEGDWTNAQAPNYFEGIQSSFENNLVTQDMIDSGEEKAENLGKYKAEVKSIGKNILKNSNDVSQSDSGWISYDNANITNEYYEGSKAYSTNGYAWSSYGYPIYNLVKNNLLDTESNYTFSCYVKSSSDSYSPTLRFYINDKITEASGTVISNSITTSWQRISITFKFTEKIFSISDSSKNSKHYAIRVEPQEASLNGEYLLVSCLQLEKNNAPTEYEQYKESINTFYLNSPLLEGDTIEYINDQAIHVHRHKKVLIDGSDDEGWYENSSDSNGADTNIQFVTSEITRDSISNTKIFVDTVRNTINSPSDIGLKIGGDNTSLYFRVLKSELQTQDIIGFKKWLRDNPTTIVYQLANPIYEPIKANLSVDLFKGTTHISNNSNIPATMEITVDRVLNRAVETIELAKANPTMENLSKARMWINLLEESIKKDELQSEINDINNVEDLQLERKTVTSNIDVYIKSENMLLMSLSTNHITFNDFSGVEDMELSNAINISINSSLPYQLNSYLLTEIENSDKSNRIEKDLLNIKTSDDSDYKTFNNINEKLILEDDCGAGNNKSHSIDLRLKGSQAHKADIYKTVIKFEVEQK